MIFINAASSEKKAAETLEHEYEHIDQAVNNILSGLSTLVSYEKGKYSSKQACEDAASQALKAMKVNANKGQAGVDDYVGYLVGEILSTSCP